MDCSNATSVRMTDFSLNRCPREDWTVQAVAAIYLLFSNLLLVNLVIAMFSYTFERVQTNSEKLWHFLRYTVITDYEERIPSPFSLIVRLIQLLNLCKSPKRSWGGCKGVKVADCKQADLDKEQVEHIKQADPDKEQVEHIKQADPDNGQMEHIKQADPDKEQVKHIKQADPDKEQVEHIKQADPDKEQVEHIKQADPDNGQVEHIKQADPGKEQVKHDKQADPDKGQSKDNKQADLDKRNVEDNKQAKEIFQINFQKIIAFRNHSQN